jgi:hypothetical protein
LFSSLSVTPGEGHSLRLRCCNQAIATHKSCSVRLLM